MKYVFVFLVATTLFFSCKKEDEEIVVKSEGAKNAEKIKKQIDGKFVSEVTIYDEDGDLWAIISPPSSNYFFDGQYLVYSIGSEKIVYLNLNDLLTFSVEKVSDGSARLVLKFPYQLKTQNNS